MLQDGSGNRPAALDAVALRYPEQTSLLCQVFRDTTTSYKLFWFLALLSLLKRPDTRVMRPADLLTEMVVGAWHPVCFFRLSLGRRDKLQDVVVNMQLSSGLPPHVEPAAIRRFIEDSATARGMLDYFWRYVPTRFLTPWFAEDLRRINDAGKDTRIKALARESQLTSHASLYYFETSGAGDVLRMNDSWRAFLTENLGVVESFAEHRLALYLQARNPNVPGVLNKLRAPTARELTAARHFWRFVRTDFGKAGKPAEFLDIYSRRPLGESFSIDHFLPWSFVVHDLLWNLTPVEPATNSSKNDVLPDLNIYLPRLAKLHFGAIDTAKERPKLLEDYTDCFMRSPADLLALGESGLQAKYRQVMEPQAQIARNQGFQSGWTFRN